METCDQIMEEFTCQSQEFEVQLLGFRESLKILEGGNVVPECIWVGLLKAGGQLGTDLTLTSTLRRIKGLESRPYWEIGSGNK